MGNICTSQRKTQHTTSQRSTQSSPIRRTTSSRERLNELKKFQNPVQIQGSKYPTIAEPLPPSKTENVYLCTNPTDPTKHSLMATKKDKSESDDYPHAIRIEDDPNGEPNIVYGRITSLST